MTHHEEELGNLLFPEINETIACLEKKYPPRQKKEGAEVTRFAPSPTGFLHTGSLFTALVSFLVAKTTGGTFYIRLEDTDTKRKIDSSETSFLNELDTFKIIADEGIGKGGEYGPYKQSERIKIYQIVIKELIKKGMAYVCFCTPEELEEIREVQKASKQITGYYGNYAKCRYLSIDEVIKRVKNNERYVIRFRSSGNHENKVTLTDEIRGNLNISENDIDIIIMKNDGLPTYHFAHVVDDHLMRTTTVIRGEEWLASFPIHAQLFKSLNWKMPKYVHLPLISKIDNGKKRKLSKRLDKEATVSFFLENGYPVEAVLAYLLSTINYTFERWVLENHFRELFSFPFAIKKINLDSTLFNIKKLNFFSREFLSSISAAEITARALSYGEKYDKRLATLIKTDEDFFLQIMNIEREKENPRKDYVTFKDIYPLVSFFYHQEYQKIVSNVHEEFDKKIDKKVIINILNDFLHENDYRSPEDEWYELMKRIAKKYNFALQNAEYKAKPDLFKGNMGDFINLIRIAVTGKKISPSLYCVLKILGKKEVDNRIRETITIINKFI